MYTYTHAHTYACVYSNINEKGGQEFEGEQGGVGEGLEKGKGRGKMMYYNLKIKRHIGKSHLENYIYIYMPLDRKP